MKSKYAVNDMVLLTDGNVVRVTGIGSGVAFYCERENGEVSVETSSTIVGHACYQPRAWAPAPSKPAYHDTYGYGDR